GHGPRAIGPHGPLGEKRLGLRARAIEHGAGIALGQQVAAHALSHDTQANPADGRFAGSDFQFHGNLAASGRLKTSYNMTAWRNPCGVRSSRIISAAGVFDSTPGRSAVGAADGDTASSCAGPSARLLSDSRPTWCVNTRCKRASRAA